MDTVCPKCGYTRQPGDQAPEYECPACGVVYQKYIQHHAEVEAKAAAARQAAAERERRQVEAEQRKAAETARKASEQAQRQQADMIAAAIHRAGPGRAMGMGEVVGVLLVLGVLVAIFLPSADVPAPAPAAPAAAVQAKPKPAPVQLTPEEQVAAAEKRERDRIEAAESEKRRRAESLAMASCQQRVRSAATFPSSVDFGWFGTDAEMAPGGIVAVTVSFTAKNALGAELPYRASCIISAEGEVVSFAAQGR